MTGQPRYVPNDRAVEHVARLTARFPALCLTRTHITRLAGVRPKVLAPGRLMSPETEARVLAVRPEHVRLLPPDRISVKAAEAHLRALRRVAASPAISRAMGGAVTPSALNRIISGQHEMIRFATHVAVMTLSEEDVLGQARVVDPTPTRKRLRALMANGWTLAALTDVMGLNVECLLRDRNRTMLVGTEARVREVYDQIGDTRGPRQNAPGLSGALALTPADYDDDMNPLVSTAEQVRQERARAALCILGLTLEQKSIAQISEALGTSSHTATRVRQRAGISVDSYTFSVSERRPGAIRAIRAVLPKVYYWATLDVLDTPGLDYCELLALACGEVKEANESEASASAA